MNRLVMWAVTASIVVGTLGCGTNEDATDHAAATSSPQFSTVRIHIDGFKKSKSGAT